MTVYVDVLVSLNIIVNYFLLLAVKGLVRSDTGRGRLVLGALMGGAYSLTIFIDNLPEYAAVGMNLAASAIIIFCAFKPKKLKIFIKYFAAFFAVNFVFAGLMLAIWFAFTPAGMVYNNSVVYFDIDVKTLIASAVICYAVTTGITCLIRRNGTRGKIYDITLINKGRTVMTKALLDTGNGVKDVFTGKTVIIADKSVTRRLADPNVYNFLDGAYTNAEAVIPNGKEKIRLIPYGTVGAGGSLRAFVIDGLEIHKENIKINGVLLAEAQSPIGDGSYKALLNGNFFNETVKREEHK